MKLIQIKIKILCLKKLMITTCKTNKQIKKYSRAILLKYRIRKLIQEKIYSLKYRKIDYKEKNFNK